MNKRLSLQNLRNITIVGVGLLGGSVGLALRAAGLKCRRIGLVRNPLSGQAAIDCDAVDEFTLDPAEALASAELVILATPLSNFREYMKFARQYCQPGCLVTDVGSTKRSPQQWASQYLGRKIRFVGSHPMAGSERTGVAFARADLFAGATCFVCPCGKPDASAKLIQRLWELIGCRVNFLSPTMHDRVVARVSHVPHLVAGGLVYLARTDRMLDMAGPGLRDATRIASGNASMWRDILANNRSEVVAGLEEMEAILSHVRQLLAAGKDRQAEAWMRRAALRRDAWQRRIVAGGQAGD